MFMAQIMETTQASLTGVQWSILGPLLGCSVAVAILITMLVRRTAPLDQTLLLTEKPIKPVTSRKKLNEPESYPNGVLDVWFGSQTGTAEGFAKTLAKEARKKGGLMSPYGWCHEA